MSTCVFWIAFIPIQIKPLCLRHGFAGAWHSYPEKVTPMPILQIILAILLPPVAVALKSGLGKDFVINLILTLLFFLPGVIHALWLILKK